MSAHETFCQIAFTAGVVAAFGTPVFMFALVRDAMGRAGDPRSAFFRACRAVNGGLTGVCVLAIAAAALSVPPGDAGYHLVLALVAAAPGAVGAVLFLLVSVFEVRRMPR